MGVSHLDALFIFISILKVTHAWPEGSYGLPMAKIGCPNSKEFDWLTGTRTHKTEAGSHASEGIHLAGMEATHADRVTQTFCIKTYFPKEGDYEWQPGKYCVFKKGECPTGFHDGMLYWDDAAPWFGPTIQNFSGKYCVFKKQSCPNGFKEGAIYWDDAAPLIGHSPIQAVQGTLPDGVYDRNTQVEYCCRADGALSHPIRLPTSAPFFLLQQGEGCQEVENMNSSQEWVYWADESSLNLNGEKGLVPKVVRSKHPFKYTKLYYCYYIPKEPNNNLRAVITAIIVIVGLVGVVLLVSIFGCLIQRCCSRKQNSQYDTDNAFNADRDYCVILQQEPAASEPAVAMRPNTTHGKNEYSPVPTNGPDLKKGPPPFDYQELEAGESQSTDDETSGACVEPGRVVSMPPSYDEVIREKEQEDSSPNPGPTV